MNSVGGRYGMHSGSGKFKNLEVVDNVFYQGNAIPLISKGQTWYVDGSVNSNGNGKTWGTAFKTIAAAVSAAGTNGDTIFVAPGDYEISATIAITKNNLRIIGPNKSCNDYAALVYNDDAFDIFSIDANNVSIVGLGIATVDDAGVGIAISGTTTAYKAYIAGCRFDGWGKGTYAITVDDTNDAPDLTVEENLFRSWTTGCIYHNTTRAMYRNNYFFVDADDIGINVANTGANRPDSIITHNNFVGIAGTGSTTGIKTNGAITAGGLLITENFLAGTWDVTITANAAYACVNNYVADASGGALVDGNA